MKNRDISNWASSIVCFLAVAFGLNEMEFKDFYDGLMICVSSLLVKLHMIGENK